MKIFEKDKILKTKDENIIKEIANTPIMDNLFVIEGIDGCGKSTLIEKINNLSQENKEIEDKIVKTISYPKKNSYITEEIRKLLRIDMELPHGINKETIVDSLFLKDRCDIMWGDDGISYDNNSIFISDRSIISDFIYSNRFNDNPYEFFHINKWYPRPSLIILLDISPKDAHYRLSKMGGELDINESIDNLTINRKRYVNLQKNYGEYLNIIKITSNNIVFNYDYDRFASKIISLIRDQYKNKENA